MPNFFKSEIIKIIQTYGQTISFKETPQSSEVTTSKAFIQPVKYEDYLSLSGYYSGESKIYSDDDFYKYIGLADVRLDSFPNGIISHEGTDYSIKDAEKIYVSNEIFYIKAIIQKIKT